MEMSTGRRKTDRQREGEGCREWGGKEGERVGKGKGEGERDIELILM